MNNKSTYIGVILAAIMVLMLALSISGCIGGGSSTNNNAASATIAPTGSAISSAPAATAGTTTQGTAVLDDWRKAWDFSKLNWYTYTDHGTTYKIVYTNEVYNGVNVRNITEYSGSDPDHLTLLQTAFYDPAHDKFLGGKDYIMDTAFTDPNFAPGKKDVYFQYDPYLMYSYTPATGAVNSGHVEKYDGIKTSADTVTLPKGTFPSTKTVVSIANTYWVSRDAPLPVKYVYSLADNTWTPSDWG